MKKTALELINEVSQIMQMDTSLSKSNEMIAEIKLFRYKIRAHGADFNQMIKTQPELIKIIWKISRVDRLIYQSIKLLSPKEKKLFEQYLDVYDMRMREMMMRNHIKDNSQIDKLVNIIKLEIFKEKIASN